MNWTRRQNSKVAIPVVWAVIFALGNISCSPDATRYSVSNQTGTALLVQDSYSKCKDLSIQDAKQFEWKVVDAYSERSLLAYDERHCLVFAFIDWRASVMADYRKNGLFEVTDDTGKLGVDTEGSARDSEAAGVEVWTIAVLSPFAFGALYAGYITFRHFYRYYLRHAV